MYQFQNQLIIQHENKSFDFCYLTDVSGKRITNNIIRNNASSNLAISVHSIKSGIYFLCFEDKYGIVYTRKIFLK